MALLCYPSHEMILGLDSDAANRHRLKIKCRILSNSEGISKVLTNNSTNENPDAN
jgi:hypothetical protein